MTLYPGFIPPAPPLAPPLLPGGPAGGLGPSPGWPIEPGVPAPFPIPQLPNIPLPSWPWASPIAPQPEPSPIPGLDPGLNDPEPSPDPGPLVPPDGWTFGPDPADPTATFAWAVTYSAGQIQHRRVSCSNGNVTERIQSEGNDQVRQIQAEAVRWTINKGKIVSEGCNADPQGFDLLLPKPPLLKLQYMAGGEWLDWLEPLGDANIGTYNKVVEAGPYDDTWVNIKEVYKDGVPQTLPDLEPLNPTPKPKPRPLPVPIKPLPVPEPLPIPVPFPEPEPQPDPLEVPSPNNPTAPPITIPKAPPAEPETPTRPSPYPLPLPTRPATVPAPLPIPGVPTIPEPSPDPNPVPAPGPIPLPSPGPVPIPEIDPDPSETPIPGTPNVPIPTIPDVAPAPDTSRPTNPDGSIVPVPAPSPKPTPPNQHFPVPGEPPVTDGGVRPDLASIAAEVGRIEQKVARTQNNQKDIPWWLIGPLLEALSALLEQDIPGTTYQLQGVCEPTDSDGKQPVAEFPVAPAKNLGAIINRLDTMDQMLQQHLAWKTPTCSSTPRFEGDFRTITFISDEVSPNGKSRLLKRFRYRSTSSVGLEYIVDHWKDFVWEAGPVCVQHAGSSWGTPQVWAASIDEGKRVIRHAAGEAGIDPDQDGRWVVSGSNSPRYGVPGTMRVNQKGGYFWITARDGPTERPQVAKT